MVTLKFGKSHEGYAVNAGASTSTDSRPNHECTCRQNECARGTEHYADCRISQRKQEPSKFRHESTDSDSSLPDIPPLSSASVNVENREDEDDSDDEGPDYEPVWKRAKRNSVTPKTPVTSDDELPTPPLLCNTAALPAFYDLTDQSLENVDSEGEEVTFVKLTTKTPLIFVDDDDAEVIDAGGKGVKREGEASSTRKREMGKPCWLRFGPPLPALSPLLQVESRRSRNTGREMSTPVSKADVIATENGDEIAAAEKGDDLNMPVKGAEIAAPEKFGDGGEEPSGSPAPNEMEAVALASVVIDVPEDPSPPPPPPISASLEETVPEKYRTLFFTFPASSSVPSDPQARVQALRTLFAQFGEIHTLGKIKKRRGSIVFTKFSAVDACVKAKPLSIGGALIDIRRTRAKVGKNETVDKIYVSGVHHLTSPDLTRYFKSFGAIKEANVLPDRGFAFVTFEDGDSADKAVLQRFHSVDGLTLEAKRAIRRDSHNASRPRPFHVPNYDMGPLGRASTVSAAVTPFPRLVDIKPEGAGPSDRRGGDGGGIAASNLFKVKSEPVKSIKTEPVTSVKRESVKTETVSFKIDISVKINAA